MTKEQFNNYDKQTAFCINCNKEYDIKNFMYSFIRLDGTSKECRFCSWLKRHNGIPLIDGYTKEQIETAIKFILFEKSIYFNDLAIELNLDIIKTIDLVSKLKIGNKFMTVKTICDYCGKDMISRPDEYKSKKNHYCSQSCYWKHKSEIIPKGESNPYYSRIDTTCTNCGKDIKITPYQNNIKNSYGDNHNFCSQKCYWEYRSKYYVGDKSVSANTVFTPERLEKMRLTILENCRNSKRFDSKIQLKINQVLDDMNIRYEREYVIGYFAIDNYLSEYNLMIEVMGDYWHTSPLKYNEDKYMINEMQQKGLQHDKQKHTYIKNHRNIEILYLWEYDIDNNIQLCKKLIQSYIDNNGFLMNYHSFNWRLQDNNLIINNEIIRPYQDMKTDEYHHLIKRK